MKPTSSFSFRYLLAFAAGCLALAGCGNNSTAPATSSGSTDAASSAPPAAAPAASSDSMAATTTAKKNIVVGFAQTGTESDWRNANTKSIKDEAEKRGVTLKFNEAESKMENEITAVKNFITQKVDVIVIAPIDSAGWDSVLEDAKKANIPVIIEDRSVTADKSLYKCFIGSDFLTEGKMAADWLIKNSGGKGNILELQGEIGSAAELDRHKSFVDEIASAPGLKIIDAQSGAFREDKGKEVMQAWLKKYQKGDFNIVYAHNDDMALGAIQAIEEAGLQPGKDIMIISVDGTKKGVQAIVDGKINCVVECNPMVGPLVFDAIDKILAGQPVAPVTYNKDTLFDSTNAAEAVKTRPY